MDRPRRIRIVTGIGIGLLSLFVAYFGAPLVAMLIWPPPNLSGDMDSMAQSFSQASQIAAITNRISFCALLLAGACFTYVLIDTAIWFVGPPESDVESND